MDAFDAMEEELKRPKGPFKIPQTYAEALMLAGRQAEQIELDAPKLEAYDDYDFGDADYCLLDGLKMAGYRKNCRYTEWLTGSIFQARPILTGIQLPHCRLLSHAQY